MNEEELIEGIGENVDKLITVDIGGRGVISKLYSPSRERQGGGPLTLLAARKLKEVVKEGDIVLISTGMLIYPYYELGETDGPLGAASLARGLQICLKAKPVIITDKVLVSMMTATCRGANLNVLSLDRLKEVPLATAVIDFPIDEDVARENARSLMEELKPKALIAIERRGPNEKGVYHSWKGRDMSAFEAKIGILFEEAKKSGVLTIGIGDGGNEIGLGKIQDIVRKFVPFGSKCLCPCGAGIADSTKVDITITATVSNWGAYGICACLSALSRDEKVLHNSDIEKRMLRECVDAGGIDGVRCVPEPSVDDIQGSIHEYVVEILREIVHSSLRGPK